MHEFDPACARVRIGDLQRIEARPQSFEVRLQTKRLAVVARHDFIDAVAEQEAAIER